MHQASVIIPTHNRPHYLREAIQSVVSQEGVDLDIIVIGDGAGDETAAVADEFPAVRYVWQPQSGPNTARNHAVSIARFDSIAMLDDDDLWLPGKLRTQLEILKNEPEASYIFSDFHIMRSGMPLAANGLSTWGIPAEQWDALHKHPAGAIPDLGLDCLRDGRNEYYSVDLYAALLEHPYVLPTTAVFRKSFLGPDIRFVDSDFICGDWEFFARLSRSHKAIYMPVETACNRSHEDDGRLTRTPDLVQLQRRIEMLGRVWGRDSEFLENPDHRKILDRTQFCYLLALAKLQLRDDQPGAAMRTLDEARSIDPRLPASLRIAKSIAAIPWGMACLRGIDRAMQVARSFVRYR